MPYPVIATGSKLSIHAFDPGQTVPFIEAAAKLGVVFPVVKSTKSVGLMLEVRKLSPKSITVFRYYNPDHDAMQGIDSPNFDYAKSVSDTINGIKDRVRSAEEWAACDYIECYNEADPPGTVGHANMGKLMNLLMAAWKAGNFKPRLIFPAFNAGTPEYNEMEALAASGMFENMKAGGHVLSVHEGTFTGPIQGGFGDTIPGAPAGSGAKLKAGSMAFRYRFIHDLMVQHGAGDVPIFVSEWYDLPARANGTLTESVKWYDAQTAQDSYLLGFAPFTIGGEGTGWADSDYTKQYPALIDYMATVKTRVNAVSAQTPPVVVPVPPVVTPSPVTLTARVGLHGRANGRNQPADFDVFRAAKIEAVKLLSTADPAEIAMLKAIRPDMFIMVRLFADFRGRKVVPIDFVTWLTPEMSLFYNAGVRFFEVHNEPNLKSEGLGLSWNGGGEFGEWFREVFRLLKAKFPQAQLGFPGLSPGAGFELGNETRADALPFLQAAMSAVNLADFVGLHSYWQTEDGLNSEMGGLYFREYQRRTGKPLYITEFSNSSKASPAVKGDQYVRFYARVRQEAQIKAAFSFVVSAGGGFGDEVWRSEEGKPNAIVTAVGNRPADPVTPPPVVVTPPVVLKPGDLKPVKGNFNQRAAANKDARIQSVILSGTTVLVKEISPDGQWVRIESTGWISRSAL